MGLSTLFSPTNLGPVRLRNRIMSSGHQTTLVENYLPTEDFFQYHLARARGGVGLVVLEAHAVHESGLLTDYTIDASDDALIPSYRQFTKEMHTAGSRVFVQLFHGGREVYEGKYAPPAPAPSDVPTDRLHVIPRPMTTEEVYEMIEAYADAAIRLESAGIDGVEVVGSHGYLPAQFWSSHVNDRTDEFGGNLSNRCRFTTEIVRQIEERTSDDFAVGIRLSAEERHKNGLSLEETLPIIEEIDTTVEVDYWSVVVGSSSSHRSCRYIVPPAMNDATLVRNPGEAVADIVDVPLILTSRIDTPEVAEKMLAEGPADVVGMTRAHIADPELPNKVQKGDTADVTPCVACNQGCIGRYQDGLPIRCTINPVTGREAKYGQIDSVDQTKSILVVGGGPAGLVVSTTAASRGHNVTLVEKTGRLGGQVQLYDDLNHRGRYERWIDVLTHRLNEHNVDVGLHTTFDPGMLDEYDVDEVVLATGSRGRIPDIPIDDATVLTARAALREPDRVAGSVLISDWEGNEAALDVSTLLVNAGHEVEVISAAYTAGEAAQQYIQNDLLGDLDAAGATLTPNHRVSHVSGTEVTIENIHTDQPKTRTGVDTVVFAHGGKADYGIFEQMVKYDIPIHRIGDCWAPRSLDEAVWEAFETAVEL